MYQLSTSWVMWALQYEELYTPYLLKNVHMTLTEDKLPLLVAVTALVIFAPTVPVHVDHSLSQIYVTRDLGLPISWWGFWAPS